MKKVLGVLIMFLAFGVFYLSLYLTAPHYEIICIVIADIWGIVVSIFLLGLMLTLGISFFISKKKG